MTDGSLVLALLRLLVSLGVVLALLVVLARWARRRGVGGAGGAGAEVGIELLSRRALGRGSAVHVVRVGPQVLVLGVTDQQVSLLRELDPGLVDGSADRGAGDAVSAVAEPDDEHVEPPRDFAAALAARSASTAAHAAHAARAGDARRAAGAPRHAAAPVPTGWPWSAASVVVGVLKGGRA